MLRLNKNLIQYFENEITELLLFCWGLYAYFMRCYGAVGVVHS